ncbi:MAG: endo-1,4-beta-xylanase [Phycisphaeraceae bacterium]|nr:endo-1,4-beta-xylanase [Phycisphaeraceae bacterium]
MPSIILSIPTVVAALLLFQLAGCSTPGRHGQQVSGPKPDFTTTADSDWRAFANERIEHYRKGDFVLTLRGADGRPLPRGTEVTLNQTRSHFPFGTAIASDFDVDNETERRYRDFIVKHFNTIVDENHMKWYSIEPERGQRTFRRADGYVRFAQENNLGLRGHTLFWAKERFVARQPWLLELEGEELRQAMEDHLRITMNHFKGKVTAWDVNNEMLTGHWFKDKLGEEIRIWMHKRAHELDPDVPLFVNEYSILGNPAKTREYIELIHWLKENGAPVHGIGIQEHACERIVTDPDPEETREERMRMHRLTPMELWESLEVLSNEFDLPIHLTETSARHADPEVRAEGLEALFRMSFAHPRVEAILLWGFWGNRHWLGQEAGLVDRDFNLTAAGERITQMLLEEWRTRKTVTVGDRGQVRFRGFFGAYDIKPEGELKPAGVDLTPERRSARVRFERQ